VVIGTQGELVELAHGLQSLLELMVVAELAAHLRPILVAAQADLTVLAAGIVHVQDPLGVAGAPGTLAPPMPSKMDISSSENPAKAVCVIAHQ
jgi:hypothetical protein